MAFSLSAAHPGSPAIPRPTALSGGYRPMRIFSSSSFSSFGTPASLSISMLNSVSRKKCLVNDCKAFRIILCFASKRQGFGPEPTKRDKSSTGKTPKERLSVSSETGKFMTARPTSRKGQAPGLGADSVEKPSNILSDREFMERLETVRRSTLEQKKAEVNKFTQAIDYDAPIESKKNTIGLGTRVGVGIAVVVFGLVFAFGDFLPSISVNSNEEAQIVEKKLSDEEKAVLQTRLQSYEATLGVSPDDLSALEGAAVTSAELGEYKQASALLEKLTKERPEDSEAYRLLGEVKYALKDYEGSATSYRNSLSASRNDNFESLRGLTNALLAAKKPEEAVQVLVSYSENLNDINRNGAGVSAESKDVQNIDPIQVQLLLGKAYSDWGHVSDAVAVYDQLISKYPNDFRGYLAKGIILKENGKAGDAERMFIQARFFAPEKVKAVVDRYSGK